MTRTVKYLWLLWQTRVRRNCNVGGRREEGHWAEYKLISIAGPGLRTEER